MLLLMATLTPAQVVAQSTLTKWQATAGYQVEYRDTVLGNGLRVVVVPQDFAPMVAITLMLRVGSRDDPRDRPGMAHLLEHLAGDPSLATRRSFGGWAPAGFLPGFTGFGLTGFSARTPTANLEAAIADFADLLQHEHIAEMGIDIGVRGAVAEHRQGIFSQAYGLSSLCLWDIYWRGLNHCRDADEVEAQIRAATLDDLRQLFRARYRADQAVLVLVGKLEAARAMQLIKRHFTSITAAPPSERLPPAPEGIRLPVRVKVSDRLATVARIDLAFRTSSGVSPDFPALVVLHELFFGAPSALVSHLPVDEWRIASRVASVDFGFPGFAYPASMDVSITPVHATPPDSAERALQRAFGEIVESRLTNESVESAKLRVARKFMEETRARGPDGLAYFLGILAMDQQVTRINHWMLDVEAVTLADVQRVGRQYLGSQPQVVVETIPARSAASGGGPW
ncbi:hypothetical protein MASR1M101_26090 [Gemmatimonas sp.]